MTDIEKHRARKRKNKADWVKRNPELNRERNFIYHKTRLIKKLKK